MTARLLKQEQPIAINERRGESLHGDRSETGSAEPDLHEFDTRIRDRYHEPAISRLERQRAFVNPHHGCLPRPVHSLACAQEGEAKALAGNLPVLQYDLRIVECQTQADWLVGSQIRRFRRWDVEWTSDHGSETRTFAPQFPLASGYRGQSLATAGDTVSTVVGATMRTAASLPLSAPAKKAIRDRVRPVQLQTRPHDARRAKAS